MMFPYPKSPGHAINARFVASGNFKHLAALVAMEEMPVPPARPLISGWLSGKHNPLQLAPLHEGMHRTVQGGLA